MPCRPGPPRLRRPHRRSRRRRLLDRSRPCLRLPRLRAPARPPPPPPPPLLSRRRHPHRRPARFPRYYLAGRTRTVVLLLHSYEVLALLALAAWGWNFTWLSGYVLGAAALHLPLDIVFNGKVAGRNMVPFYSLVYRGRAGF